MKFVVFGLTVSSSWGNGHATLWRGLCRALAARGHQVVFFEKDVPYYREHRDLWALPAGRLVLYENFSDVAGLARAELAGADVGMVTSYCPDAVHATELVLGSRAQITCFYDLDTPITLAALESGQQPEWLGARSLSGFDLVLSFTGGVALDLLREKLGAGRVAALYGHVDPELHRPVSPRSDFRCQLSYLGTYSADRQAAVEELFFTPARQSQARFLLGGSLYPEGLSLPTNVQHLPHVPPADHAAFFCGSSLTLNVTRSTMARLGYCPSGRLFEASACGAPIVSDYFDGLERFYKAGDEIIVARTSGDVIDALTLSDRELQRLGQRARERTLAEHTASQRALELEKVLESVHSSLAPEAPDTASATLGLEA